MKTGLFSNPITKRVQKLCAMWLSFSDDAQAKVGCWLLHTDEFHILESFIELESSENGSTPDLFIRFDTPFLDADNYNIALNQELSIRINEHNKQTEEQDLKIDWSSSENKNPDFSFFQNLKSFAQSIEYLEENIVAYLMPDEISDRNLWSQWFNKKIEEGIPDKVKLMLVDIVKEKNLTLTTPNLLFSIK